MLSLRYQDYSALKYQKVKVLYKDKDNVFGVYSMTDDNTVVSNVMDNVKMDSNKLKINGTKYSIASGSIVYVDGAQVYRKATGTGTNSALVAADFSTTKNTTFTTAATIDDGLLLTPKAITSARLLLFRLSLTLTAARSTF